MPVVKFDEVVSGTARARWRADCTSDHYSGKDRTIEVTILGVTMLLSGAEAAHLRCVLGVALDAKSPATPE
jgi:hypothetical protein